MILARQKPSPVPPHDGSLHDLWLCIRRTNDTASIRRAEHAVVVVILRVKSITSHFIHALLFPCGRWNRTTVCKFQDSLENVTTKGSIPIPNEAAPRRPAVKMAEPRLIASSKVLEYWQNVNRFRLQ